MKPFNSPEKTSFFLWTSLLGFSLALLIVLAVYPEILWLSLLIGVPLTACLLALIRLNLQKLKGRSAAYSLNSITTVALVLCLVGILNFLSSKHPQKIDLTQNKRHTFSDQTIKLVKGLQKPVKTIFFAKGQARMQFGPLLDNYRSLNPKFEVEYVDPDREPTRARQAGIKHFNTLQILTEGREARVEEPTEEKLTNALIKVLKDKAPTLCTVVGHGERNFSGADAEGAQTAKKALSDQAYELKEIDLAQERKIRDVCTALAILGPQKSFFEPELKIVRDFLANGGRAVIALDLNVKGAEFAPELNSLLGEWNIRVSNELIVDPLSRMMGVDASVPMLANFNREQAITKDFQGNCYIPFARPVDAAGNLAAGITPIWLGQTTPKSWVVSDLRTLSSGTATFTPGKDRGGPITVSMAIDGKLKNAKAPRNTRLVVFGSSLFMSNNYQRFGGNIDLFMNAVSWLMEDETLISIRSKDDEKSKIQLSQKQGAVIFLTTVIFIPLLTSIAGIVIWIRRKKL